MSIFEQLRGLDDLDEPRALAFAGTDLPLWPFVRWLALSSAQEQTLGQQPAFASLAARGLRERVGFVTRAALRGPLMLARPFDIVMMCSSAGLVVQREGRWFDRINDYFAMEQPERTLVLDSEAQYRTPRYPPHVRSLDMFSLVAGVRARLRRPRAADVSAIERLVTFIRERFPVALPEAVLDHIRRDLVYWALRLPVLHDLYARFFERARPRLLVIENGSYGAFAHVCSWAHAAGIATAEFQHGVISQAHLAYNYGDRAQRDETLARCLPRHLLLYGELWTTQVRTPSRVEVVGCPHFTETARAPTERSQTVLTISQGICTEAMVRLTAALARQFPARHFVFRLHPGEVAFRERYQALAEHANVEVSERGDLYPLLQAAGVVIGHSSTALVEAAGVGLPVLVLDDETSRATLPAEVGTWFRTIDELVPLVTTPPPSSVAPEGFFWRDWRGRYRSFVERVTVEP